MATHKYFLKISRQCTRWVTTSAHKRSRLLSKFIEDFKDFYPKMIQEAIEGNKNFNDLHFKDRIKRLAEHFPLSKFPMQAEYFMYAYELLEKPENINKKMLYQAYVLACATETFQSYFLIQDDIFDNAETRSGQTCWHLLPDASTLSLNDTAVLRGFVNDLLRQNIDQTIYTQVIDFFNEMYLAIEMGQLLDVLYSSDKDYKRFTMENYERLTYLKASYHSMNSPILLALILCNKANEASFEVTNDLCNNLGVLIQIHNDYTEYLNSDKSLIDKSYTDIPSGRFTWTALIALQHFNAEQKTIFNENYGSSDPEKIKQVMNLYNTIDMEKLFREEERARYDTFLKKVRNLPRDNTPSPDFFVNILKYFQGYVSNTSRYYYI